MSDPLKPVPEIPEGQVIAHCGGNVDSCSLCLRIYGDDLDPDVVTGMLGATPTNACRKGEITKRKQSERVEKQGRWLLSLEHEADAVPEEKINRLLDRLTNDLPIWQELTSRYRVDLHCGLQLEIWNRGLTLSPRTMQRLVVRNLELWLDIYFVGDEQSSAD
jgi:hypothetical protein